MKTTLAKEPHKIISDADVQAKNGKGKGETTKSLLLSHLIVLSVFVCALNMTSHICQLTAICEATLFRKTHLETPVGVVGTNNATTGDAKLVYTYSYHLQVSAKEKKKKNAWHERVLSAAEASRSLYVAMTSHYRLCDNRKRTVRTPARIPANRFSEAGRHFHRLLYILDRAHRSSMSASLMLALGAAPTPPA